MKSLQYTSMKNIILLLALIFSFGTTLKCSRINSLYTSIDHMVPLVEIERRLGDIAASFIQQVKENESDWAPFANGVGEARLMSEEDPEKYLGNPVNCYLIIKRFVSGWDVLNRTGADKGFDKTAMKDMKAVLDHNQMYLPSKEVDLPGAIFGILRLQDVYMISATDIAEGEIAGIMPSLHKFSAEECLEIADLAYQHKRYVRMKQWLLEAERLINDKENPQRHGNASRPLINEYLAWSSYIEGDMKKALEYTKLILEDWPDNQLHRTNKGVYTHYVTHNIKPTMEETTYMKLADDLLQYASGQPYVQSCREKDPKLIGLRDVNNLRSYYKQDTPRLILKPVKITQVHDYPEVFVIHDMLSDNQIERLLEVASPRLAESEVVDPYNGSRVTATYRVSKSMFLENNFPRESRLNDELNPIFEDVTDLSMQFAETLQMNNYGLGGQYEYHHDYGFVNGFFSRSPDGNRLATLLIYLSDVEAGGETIFTLAGLSLAPVKGSAVLWYNLHRNGKEFHETQHASCPVLSGSKWVANKWIRSNGNEFKRRCPLTQHEFNRDLWK